jgi:hypothetical protein
LQLIDFVAGFARPHNGPKLVASPLTAATILFSAAALADRAIEAPIAPSSRFIAHDHAASGAASGAAMGLQAIDFRPLVPMLRASTRSINRLPGSALSHVDVRVWPQVRIIELRAVGFEVS